MMKTRGTTERGDVGGKARLLILSKRGKQRKYKKSRGKGRSDKEGQTERSITLGEEAGLKLDAGPTGPDGVFSAVAILHKKKDGGGKRRGGENRGGGGGEGGMSPRSGLQFHLSKGMKE